MTVLDPIGSGSNLSTNSSVIGSEVEIVRQRFFIDYTTKTNAYFSEEYTFLCRANKYKKIENIILTTPVFLPNLKIYDYDGSLLPLANNELTKGLFEDALENSTDEDEKESVKKLLDDMKHNRIFVLWIKLPRLNPLFGQGMRVIRLEYDARKEEVKDGEIELQFRSESPHDVFYIIKRPIDYDLTIKKITLVDDGEKHVYNENLNNEGKKIINPNENHDSISIYLKPNVKAQMSITYEFKPKKNIISFTRMILIFLAYVPSQLFIFHLCSLNLTCNSYLPSNIAHLLDKDVEIGVGVIGASIVIAGLINNSDIRGSLKWWYLAPVVITIIFLIFK